MSHAADTYGSLSVIHRFIHLGCLWGTFSVNAYTVSIFHFSQNLLPAIRVVPFSTLLSRLVSATEGSGHSSGEELAGDLGQCGDHDGGLFLESVPGFGQEEGGPDYHRL